MDFLRPDSLKQAVEFLKDQEELRILAGGTDLIIGLREKHVTCQALMDCKAIPELQVLQMGPEGLEIGGAVTLNQLLASELLDGPYDILKQSARVLANSLLRNRATLAGNLCNASPGGDMLPACLVLEGFLETVSPEGERRIPLKDFFVGVKKHVLKRDEMVVKVVLPPKQGKGSYMKKQRIRGHDLAQVSAAGFYEESGRLLLAFGAVGPTPVLLDGLGTFTREELAQKKQDIINSATQAVKPISDVRSTKEYRISMLQYFTGEILDEITQRIEVCV